MNKLLLTTIIILIILVGGFFALNSYIYNEKQAPIGTPNTPGVGTSTNPDGTPTPSPNPEPYACTADAKICPDGSAVGRTGPKCEFMACPAAGATLATTSTYLGGSVTALNVTVSPKAVVSDSRCPSEVTCIWAGTVTVRTVLSTQVSHGEHVMELGKPQVFGDYNVTLIQVTPAKTQAAIPESSYRFYFEIKKVR